MACFHFNSPMTQCIDRERPPGPQYHVRAHFERVRHQLSFDYETCVNNKYDKVLYSPYSLIFLCVDFERTSFRSLSSLCINKLIPCSVFFIRYGISYHILSCLSRSTFCAFLEFPKGSGSPRELSCTRFVVYMYNVYFEMMIKF